jgi:outer membrane protein
MRRFCCLIFWSLTLFASPALAVELGLDEAVQRAIGHNPRLKAEATALQITAEQVEVAQKEFLPTLEMRGNYTLLDRPARVIIDSGLFGPGVPPETVEITDSRDLYAIGLTLTQPLFTGGNLRHTLKKQRTLADQARFNLTRAEQVLAAEVKRAYLEALNDQLEEQTQEFLIAARQEKLRVSRELFTEGYVGREEILGLEADLSLARAELYRLQSREVSALARLKQLLAMDQEDPVVLRHPATYAVAAVPLETVQASALQNRADFSSLGARVEEAGEEAAIARSDLFPQLLLQGGYTWQKETNISREEVWMVGAQLEWKLFDWGQTTAEVRMAQARKRQVEHRREDARRGLLVEAGNAWRLTKELEETVAAHEMRVAAAELTLDQAMIKASEGKMKRSDLMERALDLLAACNAYRIAINNLAMAQAELESAAALSLAEWLSPRPVYAPKVDPLSVRDGRPAPGVVAPSRGQESSFSKPGKESRFVVQVGSFAKRSNAENLRSSLLEKISDRTIEIHPQRGGTYQVWIADCETAEEARSVLNTLPLKGFVRKIADAD